MLTESPVMLVNRMMCAGGDADVLRRVQNRLLETLRVTERIEWSEFYDVPKNRHYEDFGHCYGDASGWKMPEDMETEELVFAGVGDE